MNGKYILQRPDGQAIFAGRLAFATEPDPHGMCIFSIIEEPPIEGSPALPNAASLTHEAIDLTSYAVNHEAIDLTPYVFDMKFMEQIIPRNFTVTLQADWLQRSGGVLDLGERIAALFPLGIINSLNKTFGECINCIQKSGYTMIESSFERIAPPATGPLDMYPTAVHLQNVSHEGNGPSGPTTTIERYWFKGTWRLAWEYEQKRVEKLSFEFPFCPFGEGDEVLHLKVQELEKIPVFNESNATLSSCWEYIVKDAIASIKKDLYTKYQSTLTCHIPFEIGCELRLQQSVQINYGDTHIIGEVRQVKCIADGVKNQYAEVQIATVPDWLRAWMDSAHTLTSFVEASLLEGHTELTEHNAITDVAIENDASRQIDKLMSQQFVDLREVMRFLGENSTRVFVRLKDLKTKRHLVHLLTGQIN
jgi:hypothetical protein